MIPVLRAYPEIRRAQIAPSDFAPNKAVFRGRAAARQGKPTKCGVKYASKMCDYFEIGSKKWVSAPLRFACPAARRISPSSPPDRPPRIFELPDS